MFHFAEPIYLLLLASLPLVWLAARRLRLLGGSRRYTIPIIRSVLFLLLILALARLEWRRDSKDLAVYYLLDVSDSIPTPEKERSKKLLTDLSAKAGGRDESGVIVFGDRPSLETSAVKDFDFEGKLLSTIPTERTDIGAAVRLALAAFAPDRMKRIVLLSDGNENLGSALEIARYAKNTGVPLDVVPLSYDARNDVQVEKIVVPQQTQEDAPFDIKVYLQASQETQGKLRIFEDGNLIAEDTVSVGSGRNPPQVLSRRLTDGGFHTYSATFEAAGDLRPQNNKANAFTYLKAEPTVLLVEGRSPDDARFLVSALKTESIAVTLTDPSRIPTSLEELQRYDSVVLSNVAASEMSAGQMRMLERGVHDLGIGLVMIGGENSFGAGGYLDSPIEEALPVSMDVKQKKMLPNGALVIVLHTCEIPSGNAWAREISMASLNVLSPQDYFGIVYFGQQIQGGGQGTTSQYGAGWGDYWAWEPAIQKAADKKTMRTLIKSVQPMDMPTFDPSLRLAADELANIKAQTKHIVVISDGDPAPPAQSVVTKIRDSGITVSGVAIAPHDPATVESLKEMAYWGSGNFYYPKSADELPRIFTKEATIVRKSLIREEVFVPQPDAPSEVLLGLGNYPSMNGYVVTTMKDLATQALSTGLDDPLLAHWRYGLGKSVAFTSDAKDRWASDWVTWGSFAKFWSQTIRWSLRETNNPNFQVNTELTGGTGKITVDAVDEGGNFQNFLKFKTTVIGPDFKPQDVTVQQVAPGRYEGNFPAGQVGTYMLSLQTGDGKDGKEPQFLTSGVSLSYSPEYQTSRSNENFLKKIAEASGGAYAPDTGAYDPYQRNLPPSRRAIPLWPSLLLLATILLPFDVFARRVFLDWKEVRAWVGERMLGILPKRAASEDKERMGSLMAAKQRATADKDAEREERRTREDFRERLAEREGEGEPQGNIFAQDDPNAPQASKKSSKQTYSADTTNAPPPANPQGGMGSLMDAKKRAQKRKK